MNHALEQEHPDIIRDQLKNLAGLFQSLIQFPLLEQVTGLIESLGKVTRDVIRHMKYLKFVTQDLIPKKILAESIF